MNIKDFLALAVVNECKLADDKVSLTDLCSCWDIIHHRKSPLSTGELRRKILNSGLKMESSGIRGIGGGTKIRLYEAFICAGKTFSGSYAGFYEWVCLGRSAKDFTFKNAVDIYNLKVKLAGDRIEDIKSIKKAAQDKSIWE